GLTTHVRSITFQNDVQIFFFSSRRRHTRSKRDWSSDVCSSDLSRWRSASSATCDCTRSPCTWSHAKPVRRAPIPYGAAAAALAQAGVPRVPAAAHRGVQEHPDPRGAARDRGRGGAGAGRERGGGAVLAHRGAAARACGPHHRPAAAAPHVPALAPETPRTEGRTAGPHALALGSGRTAGEP